MNTLTSVHRSICMKVLVDGLKVAQACPTYTIAAAEQQRRDRITAEVRRDAAQCDCWRVAGPICARCKLAQVVRPR